MFAHLWRQVRCELEYDSSLLLADFSSGAILEDM